MNRAQRTWGKLSSYANLLVEDTQEFHKQINLPPTGLTDNSTQEDSSDSEQ